MLSHESRQLASWLIFDVGQKTMTFRDDNTLEDIHGLILTLLADVGVEAPEFPAAPRLAELVARIENKLSRNLNAVRANWFTIALWHAKEAKSHVESRNSKAADTALRKCWEHLEAGNKARRRKATFVVTLDGMVHAQRK